VKERKEKRGKRKREQASENACLLDRAKDRCVRERGRERERERERVCVCKSVCARGSGIQNRCARVRETPVHC